MGGGGRRRALVRVALVLLAIQAVRAATFFALVRAFPPGSATIPFQVLNGASVFLTGTAVLLAGRPAWRELGWDLRGAPRRARMLSLAGAALVLLLVGTSLGFSGDMFIMNVTFGLVVPAFEESIFRGWVFARLRDDVRLDGWRLVLAGAAIFGLWHLGYTDVLLQHPAQAPVAELLAFKVAYGTLIGVAFGWLRLKTGNVYSSFVLHALNNVLAP